MPNYASIVPPPSGGGYVSEKRQQGDAVRASIVPPPSGGGYEFIAGSLCRSRPGFNCAAPFRGRLRRRRNGAGHRNQPGFNCAAPFRGRLRRIYRSGA